MTIASNSAVDGVGRAGRLPGVDGVLVGFDRSAPPGALIGVDDTQ
jgi:hypothetical protein